jgi:hypothetical protein
MTKMRIEREGYGIPFYYEVTENEAKRWREHHLILGDDIYWWSEERREWMESYEEATTGEAVPQSFWDLPERVVLAMDFWGHQRWQNTHKTVLLRELHGSYNALAEAIWDILAVWYGHQTDPEIVRDVLKTSFPTQLLEHWLPDVSCSVHSAPVNMEEIRCFDLRAWTKGRGNKVDIIDLVGPIRDMAEQGLHLNGDAYNEPDSQIYIPGGTWESGY